MKMVTAVEEIPRSTVTTTSTQSATTTTTTATTTLSATISPTTSITTSFSKESISQSVIAGYVAGICGVIVGHPMDSTKVWMQTRDFCPGTIAASSSDRNRPTGTRSSSTLAARPPVSLRTLYAGVGGPLVTVGLVQSINFALYDSIRRILHRRDIPNCSELEYVDQDSIANITMSSMIAGGVLAFITSPLILIKTKQQIMMWDFRKALLDTLRPKGTTSIQLSNFYTGFGPHLLAETVGRGVYFATYETLKRVGFQQQRHSEGTIGITLQERCFCAAAAGVVSWSVIFPVDALRARLYSQTIHGRSQSSMELATSMYRQHGSIAPFYRGFAVTILRAGPVAAAVLPIYDMTLEWLNNQ